MAPPQLVMSFQSPVGIGLNLSNKCYHQLFLLHRVNWVWKNFDFLGKKIVSFVHINPIPTGLWSYVTNWGRAIMACISSKCYKTTKRLLSTQNLFPYKYFDL